MAARRTPERTTPAPAAFVHVRIGALQLHGAAPAQAARIGRAMRRELTTLLAAADIGTLGRARGPARLDAGALRLDATDHPDICGRKLAQAVARALLAPRPDAAATETP